MCAKLKGSLRIVFFAWKRASGAPGEIRTPDLLLRSVINEVFNPVPRLAFLRINDVTRLGICSVLLSSCSHVTHCSNTQTVRRAGTVEKMSSGLLKDPASYLPVWKQYLDVGSEQHLSAVMPLFGTVCAIECSVKTRDGFIWA